MKPPLKILLITCMYNRPLISRLFAMGVKRLQAYNPKRFDIRCIAAVSDNASMNVCLEYGIDAYFYHNNPVGNKHNSLLEVAFEYDWDWDYVLQLGDDDLMAGELLDKYETRAREKTEYFGVRDIYFVDSVTQKCTAFSYEQTCKMMGAGRMISRAALQKAAHVKQVRMRKSIEYRHHFYNVGNLYTLPWYLAQYFTQMNWAMNAEDGEIRIELWQPHLDKRLDNSSELALLHAGIVPLVFVNDVPHIADIKSAQNIWQQTHFLGEQVSIEEAMWFWGEDEKEYFFSRL